MSLIIKYCSQFKNSFCRICGKGNIQEAVCFLLNEPSGLKSVIDLDKFIAPHIPAFHKRKVSKTDKATIYKRDNYKCLSCDTGKFLSIDHIIPRTSGGKNDLDNYQTLCKLCNTRKGYRIRDYRIINN